MLTVLRSKINMIKKLAQFKQLIWSKKKGEVRTSTPMIRVPTLDNIRGSRGNVNIPFVKSSTICNQFIEHTRINPTLRYFLKEYLRSKEDIL